MDRVIFRAFPDGEVIALLPDSEANAGRMMSYLHLGQHGETDYPQIIDATRPAQPSEYADLLRELEGIGYQPILRRRIGRRS